MKEQKNGIEIKNWPHRHTVLYFLFLTYPNLAVEELFICLEYFI